MRKKFPNKRQSIFFVSLPKSGTVYTWTAVCNVTNFKMPDFHSLKGWHEYSSGRDFSCPNLYACGDYNTQLLRPEKMKYYSKGYFFGAHMQASYHNIKVLEESRFDRIVVLLRDPRDAFISWVHHLKKLGAIGRDYHSKIYHIPRDYYNWSLEDQFDFQIRNFLPIVINWVEGWLDYYASPNRNLDVLFVFYDELKRDPVNYIKKIVTFNQVTHADYSKVPIAEEGKLHFRKGEHNQWKIDFSAHNQHLANDLLQGRIIRGFEKAAQSHPNLRLSKNELIKGNAIHAARFALGAIEQFTNSKDCYDLFFEAMRSAGINVTRQKDIVSANLSSLATEDYFSYNEQSLAVCKQLLEEIQHPL